MSETSGALNPGSLSRKKVLGIPALYLAGGFVVVLAIIAWRAKTTKAVDTAATATTTPVATLGGDLYPTMPQGTVIVAPAATGGLAGTNSSITTNDDWVKAGTAYLITQGYSAGDAQFMLQTYLDGAQLSIDQGKARDIVITQIGLPPNLTPVSGPVIPAVATPKVPPQSLGYVAHVGTTGAAPNGNNGWFQLYDNGTRRWISSGEAAMTGIQPTKTLNDEQFSAYATPYTG